MHYPHCVLCINSVMSAGSFSFCAEGPPVYLPDIPEPKSRAELMKCKSFLDSALLQ